MEQRTLAWISAKEMSWMVWYDIFNIQTTLCCAILQECNDSELAYKTWTFSKFSWVVFFGVHMFRENLIRLEIICLFVCLSFLACRHPACSGRLNVWESKQIPANYDTSDNKLFTNILFLRRSTEKTLVTTNSSTKQRRKYWCTAGDTPHFPFMVCLTIIYKIIICWLLISLLKKQILSTLWSKMFVWRIIVDGQ